MKTLAQKIDDWKWTHGHVDAFGRTTWNFEALDLFPKLRDLLEEAEELSKRVEGPALAPHRTMEDCATAPYFTKDAPGQGLLILDNIRTMKGRVDRV